LEKSKKPNVGVVYCDPPYTSDHYSRYYHIWETLVEYDYPEVAGVGRYRPDRFSTPFSIKSLAVGAMTRLVASASECGSDVVLSYPSNGLLYEAGGDPERILKDHFKHVKLALALDHNHSTFGASKGTAKALVREQVFIASNRLC
jgi:adenine-specific DNA-methyltransferase